MCFLSQVFFREASVKQVDVPTLTGAFGILPAHVPTLQVLRPGVVTVFNDDGSSAKYFGKILLWCYYTSTFACIINMYITLWQNVEFDYNVRHVLSDLYLNLKYNQFEFK